MITPLELNEKLLLKDFSYKIEKGFAILDWEMSALNFYEPCRIHTDAGSVKIQEL